jgi:phosphate starvation-inducible protein PhoH
MYASRIGENSWACITGDISQDDLEEKNQVPGFKHFIDLLRKNNKDDVGIVEYDESDVIRSELVKKLMPTLNALDDIPSVKNNRKQNVSHKSSRPGATG